MLATRLKHTVISTGPTDLLMGMGKMTIESEAKFISAMTSYLNSNMSLSFDPLPDLAWGADLPAVPTSGGFNAKD
jgi:hypothetical protein